MTYPTLTYLIAFFLSAQHHYIFDAVLHVYEKQKRNQKLLPMHNIKKLSWHYSKQARGGLLSLRYI